MFKRYTYVEGLTNLRYNEDGILINIFGQVKDKFGNDLELSKDVDGHLTVKVFSWDGFRDYRVIDLMAFQFKNLQIPVKLLDKVKAFVIDGNKDNIHAKNVGYRFEDGKLEVPKYQGYYYIPGYPLFAINKKGNLFYLKNKSFRKWGITKPQKEKNIKGGYFVTKVPFDYSYYVSILRHRCLALVFKDYPDNADDLIVNHIDGIPGNDNLDNLEWLTRGENNIHAYKNGLKEQNTVVLIRDVLTGKITRYYSISEASRQMGLSIGTVRFRLVESEFCKVFEDGTQIKMEDDPRDWVVPEDPEKAIRSAVISHQVLSRNCLTMELKKHDSISKAGLETEINPATIKYRLDKDDRSPLKGYQFKLLNDEREFPSFTKEELEKSFIETSFKVIARHLLSGDLEEFDSVAKCVKSLGNSAIAHQLRIGEQPILPTGWQVKLENWEWEEIDNPEEVVYKANKKIMARNEITGQLVFADSSRQMAAILKLDPKTIRKHAYTRGNSVYRGYRFRLGHTSEPWPSCSL